MHRIFFPNGFSAFCLWLAYWGAGYPRVLLFSALVVSYCLAADIVEELARWHAARIARRSQIE